MKKIISLLCSLTIITGAGAAFCTSAVDATAESTETPDKTPVGTVSLLFNSSDDTNLLTAK